MAIAKLIYVFLLTLAFAIVSLPQQIADNLAAENDKNPKVATKVDEFGRAGDCEAGARLDNFFVQLNNNPEAIGYVITYAGTDFLPAQYDDRPTLRRIRQSIAFRRYDAMRLGFIDGGFREKQATEFWLVPPGAEPPVPTDTVEKPKIPMGKTFLWGSSWISNEAEVQPVAEFILPEVQAKIDEDNRLAEAEMAAEADAAVGEELSPTETEVTEESIEDVPEEEQLTPEEIQNLRFSWVKENFASVIASRKGSHGVIIFYADDLYYDVAKLHRFVEEARDRIVAASKIQPSQIQVVFGGYRDSVEVEYWVVPKGSKTPEPKPEDRPDENPFEEPPAG